MTHDEVLQLLSGLVAGRLAPTDAAAVAEHLGACPDCADALKTIELLAGRPWTGAENGATEHPPVDDIVAFSISSPGFDPARRLALETHLLRCDSCRAEVETTQAAQQFATQPHASRFPKMRLFGGAWVSLPQWALAAAAVAFAALLYPAARSLWRAPVASSEVSRGQEAMTSLQGRPAATEREAAETKRALQRSQLGGGNEAVALLTAPDRGVSQEPEVVVDTNQRSLRLGIVLQATVVASDASIFEIQISRLGGEVVWNSTMDAKAVAAFLRSAGAISILAPSSLFPPGDYEVTVRERDGGASRLVARRTFEAWPASPK